MHLPFAPLVKLFGFPDRAACIRAWTNFAQDAAVQEDRSINSVCVLPCGGPVIHSIEAYCPTLSEGRKKLEALQFATSFGKPVDAKLTEASYFDDIGFLPFGPSGDGQHAGYYYISGALFESLPEGAVEVLAKMSAAAPVKEGGIILSMLGGKATEVPTDATACTPEQMHPISARAARAPRPPSESLQTQMSNGIVSRFRRRAAVRQVLRCAIRTMGAIA